MIFTYERELMSDVFHRNYVASKIQCDRRTRRGRNLLLGHPFHQVRYKIIRNGSVDFDQGYKDQRGELSPDDLVALYNYLYLPRHHAEAMSSFDRFSKPIESLLGSETQTWIVDLGCGPGTAGLAFADHSAGRLFHYLGIDRSVAMRRAARGLLRQARASGLLNEGSHIASASDAFSIPVALQKCTVPISIVFIASYLFASKSLDTGWVSQSLQSAVRSEFVEKCMFVYLNSTTRFANRKYETFVRSLGSSAYRIGTQDQVIQYRRYAGLTTGTAQFVNDCLLLKGLK
jgi:SAM-dependent methyltransferase